MSYGYQGPPVMPFPGQNAPNSFGVPPGTPSVPPSAPPHYPQPGFNAPPNSFGMPQPHSPYVPPSCPPQSNPYPSASPMIPQSMPSYPPQQRHPHQPYPPQHPYIPPQTQSYPVQPQAYPISSQPSYPQAPQSMHAGNPSFNSSGPSMYPNLSNVDNTPNPSCPYPGGGYSGGRDTSGNYSSYGGQGHSAPYGAPAPRITQARTKLSPTVIPSHDFNPTADAEALRKAMKGFGTDEKTIINILANRTNLQRQEIENQFKTLYGKDLVKDLKSETSGNFEKLLVAMMTPLPQYFAKELHDALSGIGTDETVLIEILCTMSNHEIQVIKQAYIAMFGSSLEDDLAGDTSGSFLRLMVSLCCGNRDESFEVNPAAAVDDARRLLQAGELRFGTDESMFNSILVQRNVFQLRQIFTEYANLTGHDIENAIDNEFSGDIKKGLLAIVKCVKNRPAFFAEQLYKSMKGMGTDDKRLMRLIITRSEIDMGEIKQAFVQQYGQSLENFISDDCTGHYKKCLLALIS